MGVLLLQLSGPLQAWGDSSRFLRRSTRREPTKSGVIGLLASAQGRSREDPIEDLMRLEFGVRVEQVGRMTRDFQTEHSFDEKKTMPLTNRYYLSDAKFLVALSTADREFLATLNQSLRSPRWPLFLGRRACPADMPISLGIHDEYASIRQALESEPWRASHWYRRRYGTPDLEIACDAQDGETFENQADLPLSFSSRGRRYASRPVHHFRIANPDAVASLDGSEQSSSNDSAVIHLPEDHDPMSF
jgi:CRISPR system Cascade subunit CasD